MPNITAVLSETNKSAFSGITASGIVGLSDQYPQVDWILDTRATRAAKVSAPVQQDEEPVPCCGYLGFLFKDVLAMMDNPALPFTDPELFNIQNDNTFGQATPKTPLYTCMYKYTADELSPVSETDALVNMDIVGAVRSTWVIYVRRPLGAWDFCHLPEPQKIYPG